MNWKLILSLSLFGIAMAIASLFGYTRHIEPLLWLVIFIFYAWWIAKHCAGKFFLHGLLVSVLNGVWISLIHVAFFSRYLSNNPEAREMAQKLPPVLSPRLFSLIIGPIVGAVFGVVAGLFAFIASKIVRK